MLNFKHCWAFFFLKALKLVWFFFFFLVFHVICIPDYFINFPHILRGQSFGVQSFIFSLKMFKLSLFFNSACKLFQNDFYDGTNSFKTKFSRSYVSSIHGNTLDSRNYFHLKISLIIWGERLIFTLYTSVSKYFIFI